MRRTSGWMMRNRSRATIRALRLATLVLGIGLVVSTTAARAEDDDDDLSFEEKIIKKIMTGIGGTNMENSGIEYRERSPLVIPPKVQLPAPATEAAEAPVPNWPKDPEVKRRKEARELRKKDNKDPLESARVLTPTELAKGKTAARPPSNDPVQPGNPQGVNMLSPSQLGFDGGVMGLFKGNTAETAPFKGEPPRETLIQPPPGYQTPSPNFAYGTGPRDSLNKNFNVMKGTTE
jgi:hypothetical protein